MIKHGDNLIFSLSILLQLEWFWIPKQSNTCQIFQSHLNFEIIYLKMIINIFVDNWIERILQINWNKFYFIKIKLSKRWRCFFNKNIILFVSW